MFIRQPLLRDVQGQGIYIRSSFRRIHALQEKACCWAWSCLCDRRCVSLGTILRLKGSASL